MRIIMRIIMRNEGGGNEFFGFNFNQTSTSPPSTPPEEEE